jgi:hypothetical protein
LDFEATMTAFTPADTLHRLVKHALDSGAATSIAEAEALFAGYRLALRIDNAHARDRHCQAALLTAVALARRVFLGGVTVAVLPDTPLLAPLPFGQTLAEAGPCVRRSSFHIRALFAGWRGGIVPTDADVRPAAAPIMALVPMLAAALAVSEAFLFVSGSSAVAGRRPVGLSLWRPAAGCDWLSATADEPALELLPSQLWLIGLGHLGQAYLWALGLLPYARPEETHLVLQDVDIITPSTESTSILTDASLIKVKKTRAMAAWAERRGFTTAVLERFFDGSFKRRDDEPRVALCGLDNGLGRQALDQVGFDFVVEAGLGRGHGDFRAVRLHTLPASRPAAQIWRAENAGEQVDDRPAYERLLKTGELDRCGVTLLAGKAVGAPFVGAVAATLAVAELLRLLHGGTVHELIDLDLKFPEYRTAVPTQTDFTALNPGYGLAAR